MFNNKNSEFTEIRTCVPQGSILGPLLFSIYINDLITISNKLNFIMYADDTTIYFDLEDFEKDNLEHQINDELKRVNILGYEPADLTVHPPPPQNDREWVHFFRMGV